MRAILSALGIVAAIIMLAVSAAMNYLFLSSLGKTTLEGQVLGAASAAADLLKALLPFFIAWSWRSRRMVAAAAGAAVFAFFAGFSLLSAVGFAADNRGVITETRAALSDTFERARRELHDAESRLAALPAHRPPSVVGAEMERHKQNRRWAATQECTNATESQSRDFCAAYFTLQAELATGSEAERIANASAALKNEISRLQRAGAGQERDPQVSLLSHIFGRAQDSVRLALIVIVALLVETGSSLGLFLATGHSDLFKRRADSGHESKQPSAIVSEPVASTASVGGIEDFCLEALVASKGDRLTADELFTGYEAWCRMRDDVPMGHAAFASAFASLAAAIGIVLVAGRYRGIGLRLHKELPSAA
ncbi:hypothetical protein GIW81_08490 [Hyphomicrobium sp. xq]|uniref:Uncharacterized protein n=1 Tax=Hyphomicrobium album TaxID=2665159 RepID=A0A6I3KKA4_9HYPH|nr:hypothetical protein [Hyphomicrobium album]MTD94370.1 hypothetical protein [Hyphomicrobium album]